MEELESGLLCLLSLRAFEVFGLFEISTSMVTSGVAAQHVQPGPRNFWTQEASKKLTESAVRFRACGSGLGPVAQLVRAHP